MWVEKLCILPYKYKINNLKNKKHIILAKFYIKTKKMSAVKVTDNVEMTTLKPKKVGFAALSQHLLTIEEVASLFSESKIDIKSPD